MSADVGFCIIGAVAVVQFVLLVLADCVLQSKRRSLERAQSRLFKLEERHDADQATIVNLALRAASLDELLDLKSFDLPAAWRAAGAEGRVHLVEFRSIDFPYPVVVKRGVMVDAIRFAWARENGRDVNYDEQRNVVLSDEDEVHFRLVHGEDIV